jgi:hypothetical protein
VPGLPIQSIKQKARPRRQIELRTFEDCQMQHPFGASKKQQQVSQTTSAIIPCGHRHQGTKRH